MDHRRDNLPQPLKHDSDHVTGRRWGGVIWAIMFPSLLTAVYFILLAGSPSGWQQAVFVVGKVLQFAFPLIWVAWVLSDPLKARTNGRQYWTPSVTFGLTVLLVMLGLAHWWLIPFGSLENTAVMVRQKIENLGINSIWRYAAVGVFYVACHSFLEEYYWRWFVFGQLCRLIKTPPAIVISSLGFMAHHVILLAVYFGWNNPLTYLLSFCVAFGGAVWAWLFLQSRSLLGVWMSHALVDAGIFILGYQLAM